MPISRTDILAATTLANSIGPLNEDLNDAYDAINANEADITTLQADLSTVDTSVSTIRPSTVVNLKVIPGATAVTQVDVTVDKIALLDSAGDWGVTLVSPVLSTCTITTAGFGGLDTGAEAADTWYHLWIIAKTGGTVPGLVFSTSLAWPTMPAGYLYARRVSSHYNNAASNLVSQYRYEGSDFVMYETPTLFLSVANGGAGTTWGDLVYPQTEALADVVPPQCTQAMFTSRLFLDTASAGAAEVAFQVGPTGTLPGRNIIYENCTDWANPQSGQQTADWIFSFSKSVQSFDWEVVGAGFGGGGVYTTLSHLYTNCVGYYDTLSNV